MPSKTKNRVDEQDARLSAAAWQVAFDAVSSAIFLTDDEYHIIHCNRAARDIFFGQGECPLGKKCYRLIHGTDHPYHACPLMKVKKAKKRETMVFEQNGRWFEVTVDPVLDEAGNFTGSVHVANDITERKQVEDALRQSEERHRLIADIMSDYIYSGLVLPDGSTVTEWISGAFEHITGYSVEKVNRLPGGFASLLFPEDLQHVLQQQPLLFERGESSVEYRIRRKDGEIRWLQDNMKLVSREEKGAFRVIGAVQDITERKRAQDALRQSEERYRQLFEAESDAVFLIDNQTGRILQANSAACALYGYSLEELLSMINSDLSAEPEQTQKVTQEMPITPENIVLIPLRWHRKKDGAVFPVEITGRFFTYQGQPVHIAAIRDITERKRAEEKIRQSEETYRNLFHNAQVGLFRTRISDGKILESNDQLARMFGYASREEFIAEYATAQNYVDPGTRERMLELIRRDGFIENFEARFYRRDGSIFWARYSARIYPKQGWIEGVAEDITEQKQAEEALRRSLEQLTLLLQASESLGKSLDLPNVLQTLTEAAAKLMGVESTAIYLLEDETLYLGATTPPLPPEFPEALRRAPLAEHPHIQKAIANTSTVILPDVRCADMTPAERVACETRGLKSLAYLPLSSGLGVLILGTTSALRDFSEADLEPCRTLANQAALAIQNARLYQSAQHELAERKQAEEAIQRLNAELEARVEERTRQLQEAQEQLVRQEKLAVLGQLAGGVGHELRNPLAVINNAVYFLKLTLTDAQPKVREYLDILERETRNAEKIISDLLDFARVKSVERETIPVAELARRVLERYPPPENIRLVLDLPPDLPPLWVDARQMEQVLGNLVLNAYQAMPSGGQLSVISDQLSVTDHSLITDNCLLITVKDTGPGIPPENLSKLFEPLFTTKSHGIGLGLAVSKKLVEANSGRIEVQSEPGQGAAFTLILPTVKEGKS